jgi:hypothetical protein
MKILLGDLSVKISRECKSITCIRHRLEGAIEKFWGFVKKSKKN